jgi:Mg/Co/Ni transporter MgtE
MKICEALDTIENIPFLAISADRTLTEATEEISGIQQPRSIYVVDNQGRLQGTLSIGTLIREVIAARHEPQFGIRSLLAHITSEKVADITNRHVIYAQKNDDLENVLNRMISYNIKEIPIVDKDQHIIANVGILDLWRLVKV